MKKKVLEVAYKEKSLIGVRTISIDSDESIIGFIVSLDETYFTINEIDEYGFFIGNTTIAIQSVINLEVDDRYQKRLKFIHENNLNFNHNSQYTVWKESSELVPEFKYLIENKTITTLYLNEDNYVTGIILKFDVDYVMINNIGREGDDDGTSYYPIDRLIGLRYDGLEEQKIKLLYENRSKFYMAQSV